MVVVEGEGEEGAVGGWFGWLLGGLNEAGTHRLKVVSRSNCGEEVICVIGVPDEGTKLTRQTLSVGATNGRRQAEKEKPRRRRRHPPSCHGAAVARAIVTARAAAVSLKLERGEGGAGVHVQIELCFKSKNY